MNSRIKPTLESAGADLLSVRILPMLPTRSNAGVFSLLLNKLSLNRMASASHIHNPASQQSVTSCMATLYL